MYAGVNQNVKLILTLCDPAKRAYSDHFTRATRKNYRAQVNVFEISDNLVN